MARDVKIEVGAVNLRIPESELRDYSALLSDLAGLRMGVRVYGDTYLAIKFFNAEESLGVFVKYTEIDVSGDWFDLEAFDAADADKVAQITIPANLRPNHAEFYFTLSSRLHVLAFSSYAESRSLSHRAVSKYFSYVLSLPQIVKKYGYVESDVITDYDTATRLMELPHIRSVDISIRRPNSDDVGDDLARIIEERLREQNADEYKEVISTNNSKSDIKPNERTKKLALVGAENGEVRVKAPVNGVLKWQSTSDSPLTEVGTYKADESERVNFLTLARRIFARVTDARKEVKD